jgi:hypothetical protein
MLAREFLCLSRIAAALGQPEESRRLDERCAQLRLLTEQCWDEQAVLYHYRDQATHRSPAAKALARLRGSGTLTISQSFRQPVRLLVRIKLKGETTHRPEVVLHGQEDETPRTECLERMDFQWGAHLAVATSRLLYTRLDGIEISGVDPGDQVSVQVMDFSGEDITLFAPLWAQVPDPPRALALIDRSLLAAQRFGRPFGFPACASAASTTRPKAADRSMESTCRAVHLPWNALIGQGLLAYGQREAAAQLTTRLMTAVIYNLEKRHAFFRAYDSETGAGLGERSPLQGLAPLGLFLDTLGVEILSEKQVSLSGKNPFPWPVTVKYRGLTVTRQAQRTLVVFPDGQTLTLNDPTEAVVSAG